MNIYVIDDNSWDSDLEQNEITDIQDTELTLVLLEMNSFDTISTSEAISIPVK